IVSGEITCRKCCPLSHDHELPVAAGPECDSLGFRAAICRVAMLHGWRGVGTMQCLAGVFWIPLALLAGCAGSRNGSGPVDPQALTPEVAKQALVDLISDSPRTFERIQDADQLAQEPVDVREGSYHFAGFRIDPAGGTYELMVQYGCI